MFQLIIVEEMIHVIILVMMIGEKLKSCCKESDLCGDFSEFLNTAMISH